MYIFVNIHVAMHCKMSSFHDAMKKVSHIIVELKFYWQNIVYHFHITGCIVLNVKSHINDTHITWICWLSLLVNTVIPFYSYYLSLLWNWYAFICLLSCIPSICTHINILMLVDYFNRRKRITCLTSEQTNKQNIMGKQYLHCRSRNGAPTTCLPMGHVCWCLYNMFCMKEREAKWLLVCQRKSHSCVWLSAALLLIK